MPSSGLPYPAAPSLRDLPELHVHASDVRSDGSSDYDRRARADLSGPRRPRSPPRRSARGPPRTPARGRWTNRPRSACWRSPRMSTIVEAPGAGPRRSRWAPDRSAPVRSTSSQRLPFSPRPVEVDAHGRSAVHHQALRPHQAQRCLVELAAREAHVDQVRPAQVGLGEATADERHPVERELLEHRPGEVAVGDHHVGQIEPAEVRRGEAHAGDRRRGDAAGRRRPGEAADALERLPTAGHLSVPRRARRRISPSPTDGDLATPAVVPVLQRPSMLDRLGRGLLGHHRCPPSRSPGSPTPVEAPPGRRRLVAQQPASSSVVDARMDLTGRQIPA